MSSKIIRRDDLARGDAEPIQWRLYGRTPGQASPVEIKGRGDKETRRDGETQPASVDPANLKELRSAAYQQGVAAGEAAATQRAQTRLEPALASFNNIVAELAGMRKKLRMEAEEAAVGLALEVARRVLHREVGTDPEAILGLVKAAFQKCDARATQRLRVSPEDAESIRENHARLHLPDGLEITADRNLIRGSAIFETSRGELDMSVDTQLAEIERGFADILKKRNV